MGTSGSKEKTVLGKPDVTVWMKDDRGGKPRSVAR